MGGDALSDLASHDTETTPDLCKNAIKIEIFHHRQVEEAPHRRPDHLGVRRLAGTLADENRPKAEPVSRPEKRSQVVGIVHLMEKQERPAFHFQTACEIGGRWNGGHRHHPFRGGILAQGRPLAVRQPVNRNSRRNTGKHFLPLLGLFSGNQQNLRLPAAPEEFADDLDPLREAKPLPAAVLLHRQFFPPLELRLRGFPDPLRHGRP
jgi:hypothetical protein